MPMVEGVAYCQRRCEGCSGFLLAPEYREIVGEVVESIDPMNGLDMSWQELAEITASQFRLRGLDPTKTSNVHSLTAGIASRILKLQCSEHDG